MVMPSDPEPNQAFHPFFGQRAMPQSNADGPEGADFLEAKGGVTRIGFQQLKFFGSQFTQLRREPTVMKPILRGGEVVQSWVQPPASNCASACLAR
jgi:hypothetical protein